MHITSRIIYRSLPLFDRSRCILDSLPCVISGYNSSDTDQREPMKWTLGLHSRWGFVSNEYSSIPFILILNSVIKWEIHRAPAATFELLKNTLYFCYFIVYIILFYIFILNKWREDVIYGPKNYECFEGLVKQKRIFDWHQLLCCLF